MIKRRPPTSTHQIRSFATLMQKLGETFVVRDVMVHRDQIKYVAPGDENAANLIVAEKNYSAVPVSADGQSFEAVFWTEHPLDGARTITTMRETTVSDYIPDSTPLAEAFYLFETREWYLTLRRNSASGLITYWDFNRREFRIQLYAALSRVEELSRDLLAKDGCGLSSEKGLNLTSEVLERIRKRFDSARKKMGGNRFVDELEFHHVNEALKKHLPWRHFLHQELGKSLSNGGYDRLYNFTDLRDAVMHGRVLFPTYRDFQKHVCTISQIGELIDHLDAYNDLPAGGPPPQLVPSVK